MAAPDEPTLKVALEALLAAHRAVCQEYEQFDDSLRQWVRDHELIGRMMTVPGIGKATT